MKTEMITLADKIVSGRVKAEELKNLTEFAKRKNMCLASIALKDGTSAKILTSPDELDCLITQKGKVLTAKGIKDNPVNIMGITNKIFEHVIRKDRAVDSNQVHRDSFKVISDYFDKFEKETKEYFT